MNIISFDMNENDDLTATVKAVVSKDDLERTIDDAFRSIAREHGLGFSEPEAVRKAVLDQVDLSTINERLDFFVPQSLASQVVDDADLRIMGDPFMIIAPPAEQLSDYELTFSIRPRPSYELNSYDPVIVSLDGLRPTDAEIDAMMEEVSKSATRISNIEGRGAQPNDIVTMSISTTCDGKPMPMLTARQTHYQLGSGDMPLGFEENLLGARTGDSLEFELELPVNDEEGEQATIHADCKVDIIALQEEIKPTITDEWVRHNAAHATTVEQLRDELREREMERRLNDRPAELSKAVLNEVSSRLEAEIPDEYYEMVSHDLRENLEAQLASKGLTVEKWLESEGGDETQYAVSVMLEARSMLRTNFALDAVFKHHGLAIDENDIDSFLARIDANDIPGLRDRFEDTGRLHILLEAVERRKALEFMMERAVCIEETAAA